MICDGYTQYGRVNGWQIAYRPALWLERKEVIRKMRESLDIGDVEDFIRRHLVGYSNHLVEIEENIRALFLVCLGVAPPEHGGDWTRNWEIRDAQDLYDGVKLELMHPQVAHRKCEHCKKWWYDEKTGRVAQRNGKKLLRPEGTVTLCETNEGCPKGTPDNQRGLSEKNKAAYQHFLQCDAIGRFPDDPIVQRNAMIIRKAMSWTSKNSSKTR